APRSRRFPPSALLRGLFCHWRVLDSKRMFEYDDRSEVELLQAMDERTATMAAASSSLLRAVAEFDERELWVADGATSMTPWLAARYSLTWATAKEWVRVARALRLLRAI